MKHLVTLVVGILLLSLAFAAFSQPPQQITEKASNTEADVKAIKEWIKRYCATVTAGDFNAYRSFWTEDVVWLPPHGPTLQGIEACMEHNRPYFEQYDSVEKMSVEEIETGDPFAFVRFNYTCRGRPKAEGEPPKLLYLDLNRDLQKDESATTTPVYVKKGNWHDTMRASLEATFARVLEEDRAAEPRGFRPAIVRLTAYGQPMRLELLVAGLERLYFATLGRQTENGAAHFLSPRVFDKQGRSIELKLDGTMVEGRIDPRTARATELRSTARRIGASRSCPARSASSSTASTNDWKCTSTTSGKEVCHRTPQWTAGRSSPVRPSVGASGQHSGTLWPGTSAIGSRR